MLFKNNYMKYRSSVLIFVAFIGLLSCKTAKQNNKEVENTITKIVNVPPIIILTEGEKVIGATIKAHGGDLYDEAHYSFVFRKKTYTFQNSKSGYKYTVKYAEKGNEIYDILENGKLTRTLNGTLTELSLKENDRYKYALNSVIYFATLPYKLNDKSVLKTYKGTNIIKGIRYKIIEVTFKEEGGGRDFEDEFYYWINDTTNMIDYLAYSYGVNGGGVRFRSAYNARKVAGVYFQDYINWKASIGTPLEQLPFLYEEGELSELSRIITEEVVSLK